MKNENKAREPVGSATPQACSVICVQDLLRFVDILELRRTLVRDNAQVVLVAMTPCLVDAIAERMLLGVPHEVLHPPFDTQRVELAVQRLAGSQAGPVVVVEVACPEDAVRVRQAVEATASPLITASADLRQARAAAPRAARRPATLRRHQPADA